MSEKRLELKPGVAPPKHGLRCTQANGRCVNLHCPYCGEPVNTMGRHPFGALCKPTHAGRSRRLAEALIEAAVDRPAPQEAE